MKVNIFIPVYHPERKFLSLLRMLKVQKDVNFVVHVIDSAAMGDEYKKLLSQLNHATYQQIEVSSFNHGGTRQECIDQYPDSEICVFLTQDAILFDEYSIARLVKAFDDPSVGCAYGRQIPHPNAKPFAVFARLFNYKEDSYTFSYDDRTQHGIKTAFCSNSFAAYRHSAMDNVGGFPNDTILSEDMYVAAKMLMAGWKISYVSSAKVYHSHDYSVIDEFKRYFDIGVFHERESWIREKFGQAEGEGGRFVLNEVKYLYESSPMLIPSMIVRDGLKYLGYRLGLKERFIPRAIKKRFSMNSRFW